ncbi:EamA family transporter [Pedobacter sp. UBA4863]|uniref:EamA family transporter n=1 Tax=Pedobacter sp. UBA4863 TaxID=1947060 RepID=UPI0025D53AE4|nr:EamA family transporter [Pedobacter sp. UBA4863]
MKIKNIPPIPAVLLAIVSVQGGAAIAKGIFPIMGPAGTVALRIGLSAIMLLAIHKPNFSKITTKQWKLVACYGLVLGAMNTAFYLSLSKIPLGLAVTLEFIGPLVLAISTSRKGLDLLWALLAALGIAFIAPWSGNNNNIDLIGAALALLAGAFWTAYIVIGGKLSQVMDGGKAVSIGLLVASIVAIPAGIIEGNLLQLNFTTLLMGLGIALLSSAIPYTLEMNALKHIPAKTFSILMSLEPAVAAFCGLLFLHEQLSVYEWAAIALVVMASTGATLSKTK